MQKPCPTKEDVEHLDKRSVDGSESKFTQWELELQASMEKLNHLSMEALHVEERDNAPSLHDVVQVDTVNMTCYDLLTAEHFNAHGLDQRLMETVFEQDKFISKQAPCLRRSCSTTNSMVILGDKSAITSKSNISKSLSNSPVNRTASNLENRITMKVESTDISRYVPNKISRLDTKERKAQSSWDINASPDIDIDATNAGNPEKNDCSTNDTLVNKSRVQLTNLSTTQVANIKFLPAESSSSERHFAASPDTSQRLSVSSQDDAALPSTRSSSGIPQKSVSCSANSSPMKLKKLLISSIRSSDSAHIEDINGKESIANKYTSKTASIRELPLLSLFGRASTLSATSKSCSMIDLDSKQNLKILLDNDSLLANIQAVSVERLANVRHKLVNDYPGTTADDIKK